MRRKIDIISFQVSDQETAEPEITIDMPSYFKVDAQRLWDVLLRELIRQEKAAKKEEEK